MTAFSFDKDIQTLDEITYYRCKFLIYALPTERDLMKKAGIAPAFS
jgi:hypothetical protein